MTKCIMRRCGKPATHLSWYADLSMDAQPVCLNHASLWVDKGEEHYIELLLPNRSQLAR